MTIEEIKEYLPHRYPFLLIDRVTAYEKDKRLVAPFGAGAASQRGYYIVTSAMGAANPDAQSFAHWLRAEAEDAAHAIVART